MADALPSSPSRLFTALGILVAFAFWGCAGDKAPPPEPTTKTTAGRAEPPEAAPDYRVVLTIDDLPLAMRGDYRDDDERRDTVRKLVELLNDRGIPFVGFFNMVHDQADPSLTAKWLEAKNMTVGNHTWSHPSARRTATDEYLVDLERGHVAVQQLRPEQRDIPFRFPYLNQGFDPLKREAIFTRLEKLGSRHTPVTIDTSDWMYAQGYLDALHAENQVDAERWRQAWLWNIQETTVLSEHLAEDLFGRLPPQILLLHGNRLNADHLGEALDWYEQRGYRFVALADAFADPAYDEEDRSFSPIGLSHWLRLRRSRDMELPEVPEGAE